MIEFTTSRKGQIAAGIFEQAKEALGVAAASNWMFAANSWLGGKSPIGAIREGHEALVQRAVDQIKENRKKAA